MTSVSSLECNSFHLSVSLTPVILLPVHLPTSCKHTLLTVPFSSHFPLISPSPFSSHSLLFPLPSPLTLTHSSSSLYHVPILSPSRLILTLPSLTPLQGGKCVVAGVLLFGVIPLMLGLLCDLIIFTPLRVPLDRTPVYFLSTVCTDCHDVYLQ